MTDNDDFIMEVRADGLRPGDVVHLDTLASTVTIVATVPTTLQGNPAVSVIVEAGCRRQTRTWMAARKVPVVRFAPAADEDFDL